MRIAVDFDGTIAEHRYPEVGLPIPGAIEALKSFQEAGAELILWTMRSGEPLQDAVDWCAAFGLQFKRVNEGLGDKNWTTSPKVFAHLYIDDAAFGCPLIESYTGGERLMVDWSIVGPAVLEMIKAG